jgi:sulfide:quinone oxidoreductase
VDYAYLVIATGPKVAFDEVEGPGPEGGYTQSACTLDHANHAYQNLLDAPGHVVFGAVQGASCFGPSVELAFIGHGYCAQH